VNMTPPRLLAFCDAPMLHSGFARVARNLFQRWPVAGGAAAQPHRFGLDVWAVGFQGWGYEKTPFQLYPAGSGVEPWHHPKRLVRFLDLLDTKRYTHVWMLQDAFGFPKEFAVAVRERADAHGIRLSGYWPVDCGRWEPSWAALPQACHARAAYTEFGRRVMQASAPDLGPCAVIPHGCDDLFFQPDIGLEDRAAVRRRYWRESFVGPDDFLLVMVAMHQRRKDVTRALEIVAGLRAAGVPAKLALHMGRFSDGGDAATDLEQIGAQLGLTCGVEYVHHEELMRAGLGALTDPQLRDLYRAADVMLTTTLGEGWGLPITEALACGCPVAVPDHTACGEIVRELIGRGMDPARAVLLAADERAPVFNADYSRLRSRVSLDRAVPDLKYFYLHGAWRERPPLPSAAREWLSWDRIAGEMWRLVVGQSEPPPMTSPWERQR
jgi:glycosyltransferase involved in cell wall biosynthesis